MTSPQGHSPNRHNTSAAGGSGQVHPTPTEQLAAANREYRELQEEIKKAQHRSLVRDQRRSHNEARESMQQRTQSRRNEVLEARRVAKVVTDQRKEDALSANKQRTVAERERRAKSRNAMVDEFVNRRTETQSFKQRCKDIVSVGENERRSYNDYVKGLAQEQRQVGYVRRSRIVEEIERAREESRKEREQEAKGNKHLIRSRNEARLAKIAQNVEAAKRTQGNFSEARRRVEDERHEGMLETTKNLTQLRIDEIERMRKELAEINMC